MSIALEFTDIVVPIQRIEELYPGGWEQCRRDYAGQLGRRVWYDEHLFRDGAMTPEEARRRVEGWSVLGFVPIAERDGAPCWQDLCVVQWWRRGPTRPCDWFAFDREGRTAHLAGTQPGALAWRGRPCNGAAAPAG